MERLPQGLLSRKMSWFSDDEGYTASLMFNLKQTHQIPRCNGQHFYRSLLVFYFLILKVNGPGSLAESRIPSGGLLRGS